MGLLQKTKQRLSSGVAHAREAQRQPSVILQWLRASAIKTWRVRGGGFYGLGFVIIFIALQIGSLFEDVSEADGAVDFLATQVVEAVSRFFNDSMANFVKALLWPLLFINLTGAWGIPVLVGAFLSFDRWAKPYLNEQFPELAVDPDEAPGEDKPDADKA